MKKKKVKYETKRNTITIIMCVKVCSYLFAWLSYILLYIKAPCIATLHYHSRLYIKSLGSVTTPDTAAAAATSGLASNVLLPGP